MFVRDLLADQYRKYENDGVLTFEVMIKYDRLEKLESEIIKRVNNMSTSVRNDIHRQLGRQYTETYYQTAFNIERETRARLNYSAVKPSVIQASTNNSFTGLTLNERLSRNRQDLVYSIRESITKGLHQGQSYSQITNAIKGDLEGNVAKARRIVRTEAHRVREKASYESVAHAEEQG